ncbi:MAG: GTP 3',8-cyclase MoaA [Chloroflexota bacterium]|nr:GTP 3',8-cyclase MoaA [Chloroflexota bacterium]
MTGLSDSFQRPINYLRISVTDRCNLRCFYCMPAQGVSLLPREDVLSFEEVHTIVQAAAELGISKVRLTGGEPLVRLGLPALVGLLAGVKGIDDLSLTTNGLLLDRHAAELRKAGLRRVNISLDTMRPERFHRITRLGRPSTGSGHRLETVLEGIEAAREAGLTPIKINVVVLRGVNDDELVDFASRSVDEGWHVRFIELMPFGEEHGTFREGNSQHFVPLGEMMERLAPLGTLEPCPPSQGNGNGPARYFRLPGARGTIGFISPVSEHFCVGCNRLRLTADGQLRLCLLHNLEMDLRTPLRQGASILELKALIEKAAARKPWGHELRAGVTSARNTMSQLGG